MKTATITGDGVLVTRAEALRLWELTPDKFNLNLAA